MDLLHFLSPFNKIDRHLVVSTFGLLGNDAAVNFVVQVFMWANVFVSVGDPPRGEIVGSFGNSV